MKYEVYVGYSVSQVIEVEADDVETAKELAFDDMAYPNVSNRFEMDGEPEIHNVTNESGTIVWSQDGLT